MLNILEVDLHSLCDFALELQIYINYTDPMIERTMTEELKRLLTEYPVVTIIGPRQAGKTTLARSMEGYGYSNLEIPEMQEFASSDPRAYIASLPEKVIIDEIQRVPDLLRYIQAIVDEKGSFGQFILTGSYQLKLRESVSQSLAGRTAILHLYPLSIKELSQAGISFDHFSEYCFTGFLPAIHAHHQRPGIAYSNYYQTYVERDVRQLIHLKDASAFTRFLKLLSGRVGQVLDLSSLAGATGVSPHTIRNWLSILEASFIIYRLPPYFRNFGKRLIKSPKYYFVDVGLLCYLLGIREPSQVRRDPLVGSIFENLVISECLKSHSNRGERVDLYFYRDSNGNEIDLLFERGRSLVSLEVKSAMTFSFDALKGLQRFRNVSGETESYLVYSGEPRELSDGISVLNYTELDSICQ
jgi:uncharacterized protein